jgi:hypothetical protein
MSLYKESDNIKLKEKIDEIVKNAENARLNILEPTRDTLWEIVYTVRDFVIEKKRKVYGGFALNKLIESVAPKDKFYDDNNVKDWDIDFYSPDPIGDAKEIADRLHKKGIKYVRASEAQHDETYKVFAISVDAADITYVPKNIYYKIPFKIVNNIHLTGIQFMMIDYLRVLTDPLNSYFRLEKTFERLCLMNKHFPMPINTSSLEIEEPDNKLDLAYRKINEFLSDRDSCMVVGMYGYNHLLKESNVLDRKKNKINRKTKLIESKKTNFKYLSINYYEVISTEYKTDTRDLIQKLYDTFPDGKTKITYKEHYPFFQYLGYSVLIYYDNELICKMYHYNHRCLPYLKVPSLYFKNGSFEKGKGQVRIGTFSLQILYNLVNIMKARADNDHNTKNTYYTIISHLREMKDYYLTKNKKTIFDKSLFQEFIITCSGETVTPQMERQIRINNKMKKGKRYSWSYNPESNIKSDRTYIFKNSSGNEIRNVKNRKIEFSSSITNEITEDDENSEKV